MVDLIYHQRNGSTKWVYRAMITGIIVILHGEFGPPGTHRFRTFHELIMTLQLKRCIPMFGRSQKTQWFRMQFCAGCSRM